MSRVGHVARICDRKCAYRDLVGKREQKRPLGRPRHRWNDIKIDLQKVVLWWDGGLDYVDLV